MVTALLTGLMAAFIVPSATAQLAPVSIDSGPVRGRLVDGYAHFLGIPYAAPPVGDARWRPPRSPAHRASVRDVTRFGRDCPQKRQFLVFSKSSVAEDCLYLNIFTGPVLGKPRPVLVWIHGGGLVGGESDDYDAGKLVKDGRLVVVTFNYRLGRLGYFPREGAGEGRPVIANYGLMDQQFALQWVRRNIRAFGGDPDNVTIAGESAGAESVYALLASPGAAGLFHRAIAQSGGYTPHMPSIAAEAPKGKAFAAKAGCPDQSLRCLRAVSVARLLAAQTDTEVALVVDGVTIPTSFDTAFGRGAFNRVPVLSGTTRDEARWFLIGGLLRSEADYRARLNTLYGPSAKAVLSRYPMARYDGPMAAIGAVQTDSLFACPQRAFDDPIARFVPLYRYEFNDGTAPSYMPEVGFDLGAAHSFELQYLFPGFRGATGRRRALDPPQRRLSDMMVRYWSRFAASGNPNSPTTSLPVWPRYSAPGEWQLSLTLPRPVVVRDDGSKHQCAFWNTFQGPAAW